MSISRKTAKLVRDPKNFFGDFIKKRTPLSKEQARRLEAKPKIPLTAPKSNAVQQSQKKNVVTPPKPAPSKKLVFYPRVATADVAETLFTRLQECCRKMLIKHMVGGTQDVWMKGIHLEQKDGKIFAKMLANWFGDDQFLFIRIEKNIYNLRDAAKYLDPYTHKSFDILCCEYSNTNSVATTYFSSIIHVMFWEKHESYSTESIYSIREKNPYVHRLRENYFLKLMSEEADITADQHGHLYEFNEPIDVVFTWVDGDDPEWQATKQLHSGAINNDSDTVARAHSVERFRNRDELKYALRSIEMFAPFVRKIYLVTTGQKPAWLSDLTSKVTVVTHEQIYRDTSVLPTFNSSGIETQLHHIDGLSEHFLYFNDDFMLTDFCTPSDFFYPNGTMKFFPSEARAVDADIDDTREEYLIADRNAIQLMRNTLQKHGRYIMQHCPYPCRKSFLYELENEFQKEFDQCASNRFRSKDDLRPIAFMQYHFAFARGFALPNSISHRYLALYKATIAEQFNEVLKTRKYKTICINDVGIPDEKLNKVNELTATFLESYFPIPSPYEKSLNLEELS